jgi:hypothetical protein
MSTATRQVKYPCPCCGFLVFSEPLGSYAICDVCRWEDDEVQQRWPGYRGGANRESLCEAQRTLLARVDATVQLIHGMRRSSAWRPLRDDECIDSTQDPDREACVYYWDPVASI